MHAPQRLLSSLSPAVLLVVWSLAAAADAQGPTPPAPYPSTGYTTPAYPTTDASVTPVADPAATPTYADLLAPSNTPPPAAEPVAAEAKPAPAAPPAAEPVVVEAVPAPEPEPELHWYTPAYWFGPTPWDSGFELGLNGASGTSESVSFRTGGFMKRKADDYKFNASLYYNKTQSEGVEVQSNALADVRYDWLFDDSPWTLFIMSQAFYDEFQAFDFNLNVNAGFGYQWIDSERTKLTTSIGTGGSREFGAVDSEWIAEASFGVNYELQLSDSKKFYAKADYFPEWADFGNYRVLADVGMEIELNQPSNVSLKLSATDRYDGDPQGVEPHNLNYSALLIWKL